MRFQGEHTSGDLTFVIDVDSTHRPANPGGPHEPPEGSSIEINSLVVERVYVDLPGVDEDCPVHTCKAQRELCAKALLASGWNRDQIEAEIRESMEDD